MSTSPQIMAILNLTPDSFYDGGQNNTVENALKKTEQYLEEGAHIIDLGAYSSRPGAKHISVEEERNRLIPILKLLKTRFPKTVFSVDTFRAQIAQEAAQEGAQIINDISGGSMDPNMYTTLSTLNVTYVLMHIYGTPQTMQQQISEGDIVAEIKACFRQKLEVLKTHGVEKVILDVGFGFGKSVKQNYTLLAHLSEFKEFGKPLLVGLSRKSMLYKPLNITPQEALNATSVAHTLALQQGANILRVHDVKACREVVEISKLYNHENL